MLEDALWHVGKVRAESMLPPIHGPAWGYRHRARLSARYVEKKGGALVGFRERRSTYVAEMRSCEVLPPHVSALIVPLRALIGALSIRERLPQIEVAVGEEVVVLVLRILEPLTPADEDALRAFADEHRVQLWLQPAGPDSARPFHPLDAPPLYYRLPEYDVRIRFGPTDFTQVNQAVNGVLVRRAMQLLAPSAGRARAGSLLRPGQLRPADRPARRGGDGHRGQRRAGRAGAGERAGERTRRRLRGRRSVRSKRRCARLPRCDAMLVDPPREGAIEVVKALGDDGPGRIVYVACDPATLARDAGVLVHVKGYRLAAAGVANMFPHTAHVESVALFLRA